MTEQSRTVEEIESEIQKMADALEASQMAWLGSGREEDRLTETQHFRTWDEMMELKRELQEMKKAGS